MHVPMSPLASFRRAKTTLLGAIFMHFPKRLAPEALALKPLCFCMQANMGQENAYIGQENACHARRRRRTAQATPRMTVRIAAPTTTPMTMPAIAPLLSSLAAAVAMAETVLGGGGAAAVMLLSINTHTLMLGRSYRIGAGA